MVGLEVKFHKSLLVKINISSTWFEDATLVLNCKMDTLPFKNLGLPIGENTRRRTTSLPVLKAIRNRLNFTHLFRIKLNKVIKMGNILTTFPEINGIVTFHSQP